MFTTKFFKTLGPGILFATTAIGVSHLVQSTRAGAEYGFALIGFVLMANILKYPFFLPVWGYGLKNDLNRQAIGFESFPL